MTMPDLCIMSFWSNGWLVGWFMDGGYHDALAEIFTCPERCLCFLLSTLQCLFMMPPCFYFLQQLQFIVWNFSFWKYWFNLRWHRRHRHQNPTSSLMWPSPSGSPTFFRLIFGKIHTWIVLQVSCCRFLNDCHPFFVGFCNLEIQIWDLVFILLLVSIFSEVPLFGFRVLFEKLTFFIHRVRNSIYARFLYMSSIPTYEI